MKITKIIISCDCIEIHRSYGFFKRVKKLNRGSVEAKLFLAGFEFCFAEALDIVERIR